MGFVAVGSTSLQKSLVLGGGSTGGFTGLQVALVSWKEGIHAGSV